VTNFSFQPSLFYNWEFFLNLPTNRKLYELFKNLNLSQFEDKNYGHGQTGYSRHAMIRALIVKNIARLKSIPALIEYLKDNPFISDLCGFDNYRIPDNTQFYRLISSLNTGQLADLLAQIDNEIYKLSHSSIQSISVDSKSVLAPTRQNNPKHHNRNLTNKHKKPKRNPEATLGYYATHVDHTGERITDLRWGYRTHSIIDNALGITLVEITVPINLPDNKIAKLLFKELKKRYDLSQLRNIFGDKAYDDKKLKAFIKELVKSHLNNPDDLAIFFGKNIRNSKSAGSLYQGIPCPAGISMKFNALLSSNKDGSNFRMKFRCPFALSHSYDSCPHVHPSLVSRNHYGCIKYITISGEQAKIIRALIDERKIRRSKPARIRVRIERYFSRLQAITSEDAPYYSKRSVRNHVSLAHITLSLVALTALKLGKPGKINAYLKFAA